MRASFLGLSVVLALLFAGGAGADQCLECHRALDEPALSSPAKHFAGDVHNRDGLGCAGCHGGDPGSDDPEIAMDPARGFRGAPEHTRVPEFCGRCHADAAFIKRFDPNLPTDQLAQYRTSVHGRRAAAGDARTAVCIDCHGVHGIRKTSDPRSSVYPTRVVDTCARCHGDEKLMSRYGISADQPEKYRRSVHYAALTEKSDLSAPTCNDCHGSHGASPPGVGSVSNVCGTCHVQNQEFFQRSPHGAAFAEMGMGACEACHGNHEIRPPSDLLVGTGEGTVCADCHEPGEPGGDGARTIRTLLDGARTAIETASTRVETASEAGMLMDEAEVALEDAHQNLVQARVKVHLASVPAVKELTTTALESAQKALAEADRAFAELRYRHRGLLVAVAVIVLAMVALILKIRSLEG